MTLWTSTQVPYIVQCLLASTLGLPENHVRVIKPNVGGAFGGKMELRPWEFCAAFLALRTGRPVKFTLTRRDELAFGRRRHPMRLCTRIGFTEDGRITGRDFDVLLDGGAYNAMGPTAAFLCGNFGGMLYRFLVRWFTTICGELGSTCSRLMKSSGTFTDRLKLVSTVGSCLA